MTHRDPPLSFSYPPIHILQNKKTVAGTRYYAMYVTISIAFLSSHLSLTLHTLTYTHQQIFVVDHNALEKILALGPYRAKQILALLGFGTLDKVTCKAPGNQTLVVFDVKDTTVTLSCKRKDPSKLFVC